MLKPAQLVSSFLIVATVACGGPTPSGAVADRVEADSGTPGVTAPEEDAARADGASPSTDAADTSTAENADAPPIMADAPPATDDAAPPAAGDGGTDAALPPIAHLAYDAQGWTVFPTDYSVTLYVDSASGSDTNAGTSPTSPLRTLAHTASLIDSRPSGQTMAVLFKRGSQWPGEALALNQGGAAADHPLLLDGWDYGDSTQPRPMLGSISIWKASHVAIVGIYIGPGGGKNVGIANANTAATDLLIEDTVIDGFWQNITIQGASSAAPFTDFRMRRSQSINAFDANYATTDESKPQGIYAYALKDALIEENVFDHNAYKNDDLSDATEFGHDIYVSNSASGFSFDVQILGNLVSRGLHSMKGPATGTIENNLFDDDGFSGYMGSQGGSFSANVVVDNTPKSVHSFHLSQPNTLLTQEGGFSVDGSMSAGSANGLTTVNANLFARGAASAFGLSANNAANFAFTGNVVQGWQECLLSWDSSVLFTMTGNQCQGTGSFATALELHDFMPSSSVLAGNVYYGPGGTGAKYFLMNGAALTYAQALAMSNETGSSFNEVTYPDATVSVASYVAQLPGAPYGSSPTLANFVTEVEKQSKFDWRQEYRVPTVNNYLRGGFAMAPVPVP